jgi:PhnB protein
MIWSVVALVCLSDHKTDLSPPTGTLRDRRTGALMQIDAYLFFPNCAAEAMAFYRGVFGGTLTVVRRGDVDTSATGAERDLVINATLETEEFTLRGSDRGDATTRPQARVALSLIGTDEARLRKIYDALSDAGSQDSPLEKVFWGDVFGALTDKFGINWQVNIGDALP